MYSAFEGGGIPLLKISALLKIVHLMIVERRRLFYFLLILFSSSSLLQPKEDQQEEIITGIYRKTQELEESEHQQNMMLNLRYRNIAISSTNWIEEKAVIENDHFHLVKNNLNFLQPLIRK